MLYCKFLFSFPVLRTYLQPIYQKNQAACRKMYSMKHICLVLAFLFNQLISLAQIDSLSHKVLTKEQMLEDFNFLRKVLEETHPALYRYTAKDIMQRKIDSIAGTLNKDMSFYDYYLVITSLIADIRCAHTYATPVQDIGTYYTKQIRTLPLEIIPVGDHYYATASGTMDSKILSGDEILSINGRPVQSVVQHLFRHLWSDGYIETSKFSLVRGSKFGLFYYMLIERPDSFLLSVRDSKGQVKEVTIPALPFSDYMTNVFKNPVNKYIISRYKEKNKKEQKNGWRLEMTKLPNTAYLRINGFGGGKDEEGAAKKLREFMDKSVATLKKKRIENLIVDLRNNGGGWDIQGVEFFTYLMKDTTPVRYYARMFTITDSSEFFKYSDLSADDKANARKKLIPQPDGTFSLMEEHTYGLRIQHAKPNRFTGKVYFLINGGTGSTASEFVAVAHSNKLGTFIGEESGGAYEGDNGASFLHFQLPNSKIAIGTPLVYYNNAVHTPRQKGRGVIPDHTVNLTKEDLLNGIDTQIEFTFDLIQKK